ncbi:TetR/AcrR family transcriptional regulator [Paenibacillus xanthanilyticus]|uniref:TetR/AcrR family transcriptional regulator n=1 Tax=Paenibacillus xanthanilyticus TaxID=1783531 RepID=A0ABV8K8W4_9BACL
MPRNLLRDTQMREKRRRDILDAAASVFARRGLLTKIDDIAVEAGRSHGHVYSYFKSKEELLLAVIKRGQDIYGEQLQMALELEGKASDKFRYIASKVLSQESNADSYMVLLQAIFTDLLDDEEKQKIRQRGKMNRQLLIELIKEGQADGSVRQGDPIQLATLFATLIQNLMLLKIREYEPANETTIDLLIQMIGP